ncbi:DUF3885 domain-containing protein [Paenibacillus castaneae]|uniref:DUF3885 domain-containing protein n=1 Tax=Paenibacillus castaneae TaxID=474957 RepID=UPI003C7EC54C
MQSKLYGVSFEPPIFYNSEISIRFELGVPYRDIDDPVYFETVKKRSRLYLSLYFRLMMNCTLLGLHMKHI